MRRLLAWWHTMMRDGRRQTIMERVDLVALDIWENGDRANFWALNSAYSAYERAELLRPVAQQFREDPFDRIVVEMARARAAEMEEPHAAQCGDFLQQEGRTC